MIRFEMVDNLLILSYFEESGDPLWVKTKLKEKGEVTISKIFKFTLKDIVPSSKKYGDWGEGEEADYLDGSVDFLLATLEGEYYRYPKRILSLKEDLYIHKSIRLNRKTFVAEKNVSIFRKIDDISSGVVYVGGNDERAIPSIVFQELLQKFPNTYELKKYVSARIDGVLSSYVETQEDFEVAYQKYLNGKPGKVGVDLVSSFSRMEAEKYKAIHKKLHSMLDDEISYTESQWQKELLQVLLLLNPKYIHIFREAPIYDLQGSKRMVDYLLVDASGNVDIVEIKKPFGKSIVTSRTYRKNHIPMRDLSGTIMQVEKYIFYLNKSGLKGEQVLTKKYKDSLPKDFKIKITNPSGIIVMGRSEGLSQEQRQDFEVVKRKYKNVVDIVTYDDLLERLRFMVSNWAGSVKASS
ncbi:DUF4263 domain-containing protein [Microbulbifer sp. MKSA007]|nr:DUF4263 domain-containing protein [Microbulbifer sp. MKSA007]